MTFKDIGLREELLQAIEALGFKSPTEIQNKAIPVLLSAEKDFVGLAQTGTGKTAAFGLPLIQIVDFNSSEIQGLVLSPTRELCLQITKDLQSYSTKTKNANIVPVYGGASIETQIKQIKRGAQIVVATPGRLIDLIKRKVVKLKTIQTVVLDEADEMLNMGFKEDLDFILEHTPESKHVWLFSATMPKGVKRIAQNYMKNPVEVTVGEENSSAANIEHLYYVVREKDRFQALKRILDFYPEIFGLIFCRTKRETGQISEKLEKEGYSVVALHGDLSQSQRDAAMKKFREKTVKILVATDVAARGIDVDEITHVIHYNLPDDVENYTHRSGRTARAGKHGISLSIINSKENYKIKQIEKISKSTIHSRSVPSPDDICEKQVLALIDKAVKTEVNESGMQKYLTVINEKLKDISPEELIKKFISLEFNKFLNYYRNAEDLNNKSHESDRGDRGKRDNRERRDKSRTDSNKRNLGGVTSRFFMNLGKKQNMNAGAIVRMVCDNCGLQNNQIGQIEIMGNFSFFEVEESETSKVLKGMNQTTYEGKKLSVEIAEQEGKRKKSSSFSTPKKKAKRKRT